MSTSLFGNVGTSELPLTFITNLNWYGSTRPLSFSGECSGSSFVCVDSDMLRISHYCSCKTVTRCGALLWVCHETGEWTVGDMIPIPCYRHRVWTHLTWCEFNLVITVFQLFDLGNSMGRGALDFSLQVSWASRLTVHRECCWLTDVGSAEACTAGQAFSCAGGGGVGD